MLMTTRFTPAFAFCEPEATAFTIPAADPHQFRIDQAIADFHKLDLACDAVIQEQDDLIRSVASRAGFWGDFSADDTYQPLPATGGTLHQTGQDIARDDFVPLARSRFIARAEPVELNAIEDLEFEILQVRMQLDAIEAAILAHDPRNAREIGLKLDFMAELVAQGAPVDIEAFARLAGKAARRLTAG
jgi:hypothetical protein